jgi:spermidine synthase
VGLVYVTVVVVSACGLVYELALGAVATFFLGDSITQFSTVIGAFLCAMGAGAWIARFVKEPVAGFVHAQLGAALAGGLAVPVMYVAFASSADLHTVLYALVFTTGVFVGAELPLFFRVLRRRARIGDLVARALFVDYAGAFVGSLLFAIVLLPRVGVLRAGILVGGVNAAAAAVGAELLAWNPRPLRARALVVLGALACALVLAPKLTLAADAALFADPVVFARQTDYQRVVLTRGRSGVNLFLDGNLQFAAADEYRYHEALVHPALGSAPRRARVLVLGGGDGLALREILRYPDVREVTLVELDPQMVELARSVPQVRALNGGSFDDPRVRVVVADAMRWLFDPWAEAPFDAAIVDFPDPNNFAIGKLYTVRFYKLLRARLAPDARVVVQSTSPLVARRSFWCVVQSLEEAGFHVRPYHALVPSFGEWGYALASFGENAVPTAVPDKLRYLTVDNLPSLFVLSPDMARVPVSANRLNDQNLVHYYEDDWRRVAH